MMKNVVMLFCGNIIPVGQGSDRYIYEVAHYLNALPDVRLTLAVIGSESSAMKKGAAEICSNIVWLSRPRRWGMADILNKILIRSGVSILQCWAISLALRRQFVELCKDQDVVLMNYAVRFAMLPKCIREKKTIVITHDIGWYRLESFLKTHCWWSKWYIALNRYAELRVLRTFRSVAVLADYEKQMLLNAGVQERQIVQLGVPMRFCVDKLWRPGVDKMYDFLIIGGQSYQNEAVVRCFFTQVVPLLHNRNIVLAVAGSICASPVWDAIEVPPSVMIHRLGYVADLAEVCARAKVGVGTVPYGSGIKVKVVEMIFNGLPIVATHHGIEGVPVTSEGTINLDEVEDSEVSRRLRMWLDEEETSRMAGASQAVVVRRAFSPANTLRELVEVIHET